MDIFFEIECLTERSKAFLGEEIRKNYLKNSQKRDVGNLILKLIQYNKENLHFLGVESITEGSDDKVSVYFKSGQYIGAVPIISSSTGLPVADFLVTPRYVKSKDFTTITDIIQKIKHDLVIEYKKDSILKSNKILEPPLFLEAIKFVNALRQLVTQNWNKFRQVTRLLNEPAGNVDWDDYARNEYKVERRLKFLCRKNELSSFHPEYCQIKYVYELCKKELLSTNTTLKVRLNFSNYLQFIDKKLEFIPPMRVSAMVTRVSDPPIVKQCKEIANRILQNKFVSSLAWRVNLSELYERYIQYIFKLVSQRYGGKVINNSQLREVGQAPVGWKLKHLSPDIIYETRDETIMIDAKYKSHLYNTDSSTDSLKEEHRHDLHQILAYSSFTKFPESNQKTAFLCYPSSEPYHFKLKYNSLQRDFINRVILLGVPFDLGQSAKVVDEILMIIKSLPSEKAA